MKSTHIIHVVSCLLLAAETTAPAAIVYISVPQESQDHDNNDSYPARDGIWSVSAPPYPFDTSLGIGHLVDTSPAALAYDIAPDTRLGVLHSHQYDAPYVPVFSSVVTYYFDTSTVVDQLEVLQHFNGVTRVEGFVGDQIGSMTSIGNVFGSEGDVRGSFVFEEGESYVFDFNNSMPGTIFQFRITQTSLVDGYGVHRAFPSLSDGTRIEAIPEPRTISLFAMGIAGIVLWRRRDACKVTRNSEH